jgi:hypothetical protein
VDAARHGRFFSKGDVFDFPWDLSHFAVYDGHIFDRHNIELVDFFF